MARAMDTLDDVFLDIPWKPEIRQEVTDNLDSYWASSYSPFPFDDNDFANNPQPWRLQEACVVIHNLPDDSPLNGALAKVEEKIPRTDKWLVTTLLPGDFAKFFLACDYSVPLCPSGDRIHIPREHLWYLDVEQLRNNYGVSELFDMSPQEGVTGRGQP